MKHVKGSKLDANALTRNLYVSAIIGMLTDYGYGQACQVHHPGCGYQSCQPAFLQLDAVLSQAARQPIDGRIHLPIPAALRSAVTLESWPVVRVNSGGTATFHCTPLQITPGPRPNDRAAVFWHHDNELLAYSGRNENYVASADIRHTVDWAAASATLTMRNVTWASRGEVACQQECPPPTRETHPYCPLQTFRLHVMPTARELFPTPLPNVTVVRSGEARFQCATTLTLPTDYFHAMMGFIWRFNTQWLEAPALHALHPFVGPMTTPPPRRPSPKHVPPALRDTMSGETLAAYRMLYNESEYYTSTLVIPDVQLQASARVECWVQPDYQREVWLMQTAYLHVIPAPDA
ncbi:uncharacterized protein LOC129602490 [Paramacrobiotus metropolitanus]|uniref:uncharacterized protein LOC129602490 n=1 Tax=Paramacrobiotus metropolitanus TaxID=2943436 RepID=UPI002445E14F|nr:uncharacterized protein LOC129602490 [Paramacrobiotus metropolitanus]